LNVRNFGAAGDGKQDDTPAFEAALKAAAQAGGNVVRVPRGNYLIQGTLDVPENAVLEGYFRAPTARTQTRGSTLLAVAGAGNPEGQPFITLHQNSMLSGLTIFYPGQKQTNPPVPYPWTIRGIGDNCSLVDLLLVNPYQAVDFGTHPAGRHCIRGLYAQALYRGLLIDQCYDVGRVTDVHFWPFWGGWEGDLGQFTREQGIAFVIGRTDWEYLTNCFCIGYKLGFQFVRTKAGAPNAVLTQCGSDIGPTAVRVESVQDHAGISFVNGQFMAGIEIAESNNWPCSTTRTDNATGVRPASRPASGTPTSLASPGCCCGRAWIAAASGCVRYPSNCPAPAYWCFHRPPATTTRPGNAGSPSTPRCSRRWRSATSSGSSTTAAGCWRSRTGSATPSPGPTLTRCASRWDAGSTRMRSLT
jgi:hypothetical protein